MIEKNQLYKQTTNSWGSCGKATQENCIKNEN